MKEHKLLTIVLFFFASKCLWSQELNSLHQELKSAKADSAKVTALIKIGRWHLGHFGQNDYPKSADSTWYYAHKSEKFSKEKKLTVGLGNTYSFFGTIYSDNLDQEKAVSYEKKAVKLLETTKDRKALCKAYIQLLHSEMQRVPFDENSIQVAHKALKLSKEIKNPFLEAQILDMIGYYHNRTGEYAKGVGYLEQSIKIYRKYNKTPQLKSTCSNIAVFYQIIGQPDKALHYNQETVLILQKDKVHDLDDSLIFGTIGDTYSALGDREASIKYCTKAWEIAKKYDSKDFQAFSEISLIDRLSETKQFEKARYHFDNMEQYLNQLDPFLKAHAISTLLNRSLEIGYEHKADQYAQLSIDYLNSEPQVPQITQSTYWALTRYYFNKKEFQNSKKYAEAFKMQASGMQSHPRLEEAYLQLHKIDSAQGNYGDALKHYKLAKAYKDSIFSEEKKQEIAKLETQFKTQEKENDNLLLKKKAELQQTKLSKAHLMRNISLAGIGILIITVVMLYRRYQINQKIKGIIDQKNQSLEQIIQEKEWLLKEIHHRVKNNLQVVISLLNTQSHYLKDESAKKAIKNSQNRIHSMSLIHKKLYQSNNIVSVNMDLYIRELVEYLKESLDTGQRICFEIDADPIELNSTQSVPLSLMLNEIIMNSIKHAFPENVEGIISIQLMELPEHKIRLTVKDNGIGYDLDPNNMKASSSLGLKLIQGFGGELNATTEFISNKDGSNGLTIIVDFIAKKID